MAAKTRKVLKDPGKGPTGDRANGRHLLGSHRMLTLFKKSTSFQEYGTDEGFRRKKETKRKGVPSERKFDSGRGRSKRAENKKDYPGGEETTASLCPSGKRGLCEPKGGVNGRWSSQEKRHYSKRR